MANYTPNYQLHQWEPEDKFLRTDFNADLSKIDTALGEGAAKAAALEAAVSKCGNCRIYETSYVGKGGGYPKISISLPWLPVMVIIMGEDGYTMITYPGQKKIHINPSSSYTFATTWEGSKLSWNTDQNGAGRMNETGVTYRVLAIKIMA